MGHVHLTRRQILGSIPVLGSGSLLLPLHGQKPDTSAKATIRGRIRDKVTGRPASAKLRVVESNSGRVYMPEKSIKTMPDRRHYFYAKGNYEIAVPAGRYRIEAVRGICHEAAVEFTEVGAGITKPIFPDGLPL